MRGLATVLLLLLSPLLLLGSTASADGVPAEVDDIVSALGKPAKGVERSVRVLDERMQLAGAEVVVFELEERLGNSLSRVVYIADVKSRAIYLSYQVEESLTGKTPWRFVYGMAWKDLDGDKISELIFTRTVLERTATGRPAEQVYQVRYGALRLVPRHLVVCRTANEAPLSTTADAGLGALRKEADKAWRASFDAKPAAQRCAIANLALLGEGVFPSALGGIAVDKRAPRTMLHYHGTGIGLLRADEGGTLIDDYPMPALVAPAGDYVSSQSYDGFAALFVEPGYPFVWFEITATLIKDYQQGKSEESVHGVLYERTVGARHQVVIDEVLVQGKVKRKVVVADGKITIKQGKKVVTTWRWDADGRAWKKK